MISKELLDMLVCPETKMPVKLAGKDVLDRVNGKIRGGEIKNRGGATIGEPLEAGLLRDDGRILYPIRDDIPIMLVEEGIPLEG